MHASQRYLLPGLLLACSAFAAPVGNPLKRGFLDSLSDNLSDLTASLDSIGNIAPNLDSVGNVAPNLDVGDVGSVGDVGNVGDLNLGELNLDLGDIGSGTSVADGGVNLEHLVNDSVQFSQLLEELGLSDVVDVDNIGQGDLTLESLASDLGVSVEDLVDALEDLGFEDVAGGMDGGEEGEDRK